MISLTPETLITLANILFLIGIVPMLFEFYNNRDALNGFSLLGSGITTIGMILMTTAFIIMDMKLAYISSIPTTIYWSLISIALIRNKLIL